MGFRPVWTLYALTAASWGATVTAIATDWHTRVDIDAKLVFACCLGLALAFTLTLALRLFVVIERDRIMESLAKACIARPFDPRTPGPWPALRSVSQQNGHGRHAIPR